jgi:uncharacterized repeat protein (TIGR03803 family)
MLSGHLSQGEEFMSRNKSLGNLSVALLLIAAIMLVAPGSWAQNSYKTLHRFKPGKGGVDSVGGIIFDQSGNLYGTTVYGGDVDEGTVFKLIPQSDGSWSEDVLYSFCSRTSCTTGYNPFTRLIFDAAGNLYGTTTIGGDGQFGEGGTVFKLAPNSNGPWTESVLYNFCSAANCGDGATPMAGLIFDQSGNLYGTTSAGGAGQYGGGGTVFKLAPNLDGTWTESTLYQFCSLTNCSDGANPFSALIFDAAGNLYGTAYSGGGSNRCYKGCGLVFELAPNSGGGWAESVLYSFCPLNKCRDGSDPAAGLIFDQAGNLYGTGSYGGDPACNEGAGCGVVFELTRDKNGSWTEQVLHSFQGRSGAEPNDLTFGPAGNLYGSTGGGGDLSGCFAGCGVVFKLAPNSNGGWKETVLHTFFDHPGANPGLGSLIFDANGNLYGETAGDGNIQTFGSVFEITP